MDYPLLNTYNLYVLQYGNGGALQDALATLHKSGAGPSELFFVYSSCDGHDMRL